MPGVVVVIIHSFIVENCSHPPSRPSLAFLHTNGPAILMGASLGFHIHPPLGIQPFAYHHHHHRHGRQTHPRCRRPCRILHRIFIFAKLGLTVGSNSRPGQALSSWWWGQKWRTVSGCRTPFSPMKSRPIFTRPQRPTHSSAYGPMDSSIVAYGKPCFEPLLHVFWLVSS